MKKSLFLFLVASLILPVLSFAQYSNASLNGPWLAIANGVNYIVFDGAGTVNELGTSDDSLHPVGTYSITASGAITCTMNFVQGVQNITGQMDNDTSADLIDTSSQHGPGSIYISKVPDPSALSGVWSGFVLDSNNMYTRNIQLTVNSSGVITAATGIPLIAGKIFTDRDTFACYITTTDDSCAFTDLELGGIYNGSDSLIGIGSLGPHNSMCSTGGYVKLVRTSTGISNVNKGVDFSVYPDPFSDQVEIVVNNAGTKMQADIYDLCGRMVFSRSLGSDQKTSLSLAQLTSGIYMLALTDGTGKATTKRIVKN